VIEGSKVPIISPIYTILAHINTLSADKKVLDFDDCFCVIASINFDGYSVAAASFIIPH